MLAGDEDVRVRRRDARDHRNDLAQGAILRHHGRQVHAALARRLRLQTA